MTQLKSILAVVLRLSVLLALVLPAVPLAPRSQALASEPDLAGEVLAAEQNQGLAAPEAPLATTNTLSLSVFSARTEPRWGAPLGDPAPPGVNAGDPVGEYRWIINVDNTGDPFQDRYPDCSPYDDPAWTITNTIYPANCDWPSLAAVPSNSPIVTQGDWTLLNLTDTLTLPDGSYIISVLADDFKIDGQWFTLPMEEAAPGSGVALVEVGLQPFPLPTATARIRVFEDIALPNSAPDPPVERGLAGFEGHVGDWGGEVTTDMYGNPLCTVYMTETNALDPNFGNYVYVDGAPVPIEGTGGRCVSDANGDIVIPNLGTNRYEVWVVPPDGTDWAQTTTLEGNKPWDTWLQEGATGLNTEFININDAFPFTIFGFVRPTNLLTDTQQTGRIEGVVTAVEVYIPFQGGLPYQGNLWGGLSGAKVSHVIADPWIALADLQGGDQAVWIGRGNADGSFSIPNVPDGDYFLSYWDDPNLYIMDWVQVSVRNGELVDLGVLFLTGWFTRVEGHVFVDDNENGRMDPDEHGVGLFPLVSRRRDNSEMDRGAVFVETNPDGFYQFENLYPMNQWIVLEAYADNYYVTGVTFQPFNQPEETTVLGGGVDINVMPVIGQSGRLDWGVKAYEAGTNGGIAGTVFYDNTRNEIDPALAAVEPWSPGIPNLIVNVYAPVKDANGDFVIDPVDGSYMKGPKLASTVTEEWIRPTGCQAYDAEGNPVDQFVLPPATADYDCLEGMLMGTQFGAEFATVDGNYGIGEIMTDTNGNPLAEPMPIPAGDYLVEVVIPEDDWGRPLYQVEREEDINVFDGIDWIPGEGNPDEPEYPPPACAGALHTVDVMGVLPDGPDAVYNPRFADEGGSPYEGEQRRLCDVKLVQVVNGRSTAPAFTFFTEVPLPSRQWGIILNDLALSVNPQDLLFGEKAGVPTVPIGIYDYSNRLVKTIHSDPNGYFQVLLPSTQTLNCPSPSGVCAGMYRLVGNDPGQPGQLNQYYDPQFRTIAANFETFPGIGIVADLAPTQVAVNIQAPGSQVTQPAACRLPDDVPQLFVVDKPFVYKSGTDEERTLHILGTGFGDAQGTGWVRLDGSNLAIQGWTNQAITATVPATLAVGPRNLVIRANNNQRSVNGLTIHVLGTGYEPTIFEVGPGKPYSTTIQSALEDAALVSQALVVVYPKVPELWNPKGAYFENIVIHSPVKLQGVGPGGVYSPTIPVLGSVINGSLFSGDGGNADEWRVLVDGLSWAGNQQVYEGATVTVFAESANQFTSAYRASIDGFVIEGGDQQGFPNNIDPIGGGPTGQPANVVIQGGGIYLNGYARFMRITNNVIQHNGGAYGGAIRMGTPHVGNAYNRWVQIASNQIVANGGTNLAGAIGVYTGSDRYQIYRNDICGNFSAEYGGAISHYGYSPFGKIYQNRIYFNQSYDEGGGIMIAGELPASPSLLSEGAGEVDIYNNIIQGNLANDDGGGLRFLMAGNYRYNVYNNIIANNVSTHEGGGVSLNDAPNVRFANNTVVKNLTTGTAQTSTGQPAPAGLSTSPNSDLLQATLPAGSPIFSSPLLFNNIFWDNRAGSWNGDGVAGIGLDGDPSPIFYWDLGLSDLTDLLEPTNSVLSSTLGIVPAASNLAGIDPQFRATYDTSIQALPWRGNLNFVGVILVALDLPATQMGDYRLKGISPALNAGAASKNGVNAPPNDIDNQVRPMQGAWDIGADERNYTGPLGLALVSPDVPTLTVIPGITLDFTQAFVPVIIR